MCIKNDYFNLLIILLVYDIINLLMYLKITLIIVKFNYQI